MKDINQN